MIELVSQAYMSLTLTLALSVVILLPVILAGLFIAILQAVTQIQEQTLPFAAKLLVGSLVLAFSASWIGAQVFNYFLDITNTIVRLP